MTFLFACQFVLKQNDNRPMNSHEIWEEINKQNLTKTNGLTPWDTVNAKMILSSINTTAKGKKKNSIFQIIEGTKPYKFILLNPDNIQNVPDEDLEDEDLENLEDDLDNFEINHRRIMGKYCYWQYRGVGCQYRGVPIQTDGGELFEDASGNNINFKGDFVYGRSSQAYKDDTQYTTGDLVYLTNNRVSIQDFDGDTNIASPLLTYYIAKTDVIGLSPDSNPTYWNKDGCNKKLSSCKLRFSEDGNYKRFLKTQEENKKVK